MGSFDFAQQAEEENELRKKQEQALMEKLLEQEALMEQQDPKVRRGQGLRRPHLGQQGRGQMPDLHACRTAFCQGLEAGLVDLLFILCSAHSRKK